MINESNKARLSHCISYFGQRVKIGVHLFSSLVYSSEPGGEMITCMCVEKSCQRVWQAWDEENWLARAFTQAPLFAQ